MTKPNLFIVGAPKCGTTSLCRYLESHPDVIFSNPKEPNYFCRDITNDYCAASTERDYLSGCFPADMERYEVVGDGSVSSLYSADAVQKILQFNPDAKFIVMLRNPIELVYSFHRQLLNADQENVEDFVDAWMLQDKRKRGECIPAGCMMPKALQYGDVACLGRQLERLYTQVPRNRVLVILYDDFKKSTETVYSDVLRYLGLSGGPDIDFQVVNKSQRRKSVQFQRLLMDLAMLKSKLKITKSYGILSYLSKRNFEPYERPPLPKEFVQELALYFESDVGLISKLVQRDCSSWINDGLS